MFLIDKYENKCSNIRDLWLYYEKKRFNLSLPELPLNLKYLDKIDVVSNLRLDWCFSENKTTPEYLLVAKADKQ